MSDASPVPNKPRPGARTPEGLERCRRAAWKHGLRSAEVIAAQRLRGEARRAVTAMNRTIQEARLQVMGSGLLIGISTTDAKSSMISG